MCSIGRMLSNHAACSCLASYPDQSASTNTGLLGRRPLQHLDIELDGRLQVREELSFKSL